MKLVCYLALFFLASCTASKRNSDTVQFADNPVVAHRGAFKKKGLPENSIAALREAIRLKCTGSEFDVRMSADDSLVINHDPKYKGMDIEKTTFEELQRIKLSNGENLPTLQAFLTAGRKNNNRTRLVVEIKPSEVSKARGKQIAERVVKLVREMGATKMVVYISFDYDILKKVLELDPAASTQYLNGDYTPEQLKADHIIGADYNLAVFKKNPAWIEAAQKVGIILNAWTVNSVEDMNWFLSNKFQFITTNEPELLLDIVKKRK